MSIADDTAYLTTMCDLIRAIVVIRQWLFFTPNNVSCVISGDEKQQKRAKMQAKACFHQKTVGFVDNCELSHYNKNTRRARNAEDGFELYERLYKQGIELVFLKEPHISTTTYRTALQSSIQMTGTAVDCILEGINEYLMALAKEQIMLAFARAQAETDFLRQRTTEGIRNSDKKSGHPKGSTYETKKEKACKEIIVKYNVDFGGSLSDSETMRMCGECSRNSFYKYKAKLKNQRG